jgi:hypothetical protein
VWASRTQLQGAADAAASAATQAQRDTGSPGPARAAAIGIAVLHDAGGESVQLDGADVDFGFFDHSTRTFAPGLGFGSPAARVMAGRSGAYASGPLDLWFAPIIGREEANVEAVASIRRRNLVLVQDRTGSFADEFPIAMQADKDLVSNMGDQSLSGDRMGVVSFARDTSNDANLTELMGGGETYLHSTLDALVVCPLAGPRGGPCFGTETGAGIDAALNMLESQATDGDSERVMVVVSDGSPCLLELGGTAQVRVAQQAALGAADRAGDAGVSIFVITLDQGSGGHTCLDADAEFNESLARGFGVGFTTTDEEDLDELLSLILARMPVYLVK